MAKKYIVIGLMIVLTFSSMMFPLHNFIKNTNKLNQNYDENLIHSSGQTIYNREWLENNDFSTQDEWYYTKGAQGDNSTVDADISSNQANYKIVGENDTFNVLSGEANSSTWYGWDIYNNGDYLLPDVTEINSTGCYVYHYLDEGEDGGAGQVHNFPSVHFKKNISLPVDMSDYEIISASLEVIFNASVNSNVDAPGDSVGQSAIWDSATFYVDIADLNLTYAFRVAENKTSDLGQDFPPILTIPDRELTYVSESDLITAINLALEKDAYHSNLTLIMGIDIYCEDNDFPDYDEWNALIFKSFNLTFDYKRKVDKFSSISWNQIGDQITGSNMHVSQANLKFKVKIDQAWPTSLSPFSEVRILLNDNLHSETLRLSSVNTTLQDAKTGGFDVTNLILKDVNITLSIQIFIANTFGLGSNITFSIDDVYLNITYIETFPDYGTQSQLFLNIEDKTADPYIQIPLANILNITIKYIDNLTLNHIPGASVNLVGKISGDLTENSGQYSIDINASNLGVGLWSLTVIAQKSNYQVQSIPFFVEVVERPTEFRIFVDSNEKTNNNTVKIEYNKLMNITVFYKDDLTNQHISGANVSINGIGDLNEINDQYEQTFNSNILGLGFNVLTINAYLENYTTQIFQLYVEVFDRATELLLFVESIQRSKNDIIQTEVNQFLNVTVYYRDNLTKQHLSGATVTLIGIGNFTEIGNQYNYTINSTDLNLGFNVLSISAQFNNYESQSFQIYIEVFVMASELILYVNDTQTNDSETIQVEVDQFLNVTIYYRDNLTKQHLSGATVELIGWDNFSEISNQYNFTIDTDDARIEQGITILTIQAQIDDYQSQTIQFYVKVTERDTEMQLFLDSVQRSKNDIIQTEVNQFLNVTVYYRDNFTKQHLSGATVTLIGIGNFTEIGNQYNYTVSSTDLNLGFNVLSISAQFNNYEPQSFQIYIEMLVITSELILYVNDTQTNDSETIQVEVDQFLNVTVYYRDNLTKQHLSGATVELIGWDNFSEISNQYNFTIDTDDVRIEQGITILTIQAQIDDYQSQIIQFYVEVIERETELQLFLDSIQINKSDTILAEVNQFLNVTVYYRDNLTKQHLSGATVTIIGIGNFTEIGNQYNYTVDTNLDLEQGISILTVFAYIDNFQPQTFQFYIKVSERDSKITLYLNDIPKTADPVFEVPIGSILNITVKYTDNQTSAHISGASIQLIDSTITENFTEFSVLNQYTLYLNTSILKIGVNLLTIIAHANNFQIISLNLRITVNKITTSISTSTGVPYFNIKPGESILLAILLNDIDFGGRIINATVTYRWAYGQGDLIDPDNDGLYEVELLNIPAGTYTITITASAGDDYDFESYEIILNVVAESGLNLIWLIFTLVGAFGALIIGFVSYEKHYKYPPMVRKMRKLRKKIRKGKKIKPITATKREDLIKNQFENQKELSNLESIQLEKNQNYYKEN